MPATRSRAAVVAVIGLNQIFAWGSSYYLPAVLAGPIAADTGWAPAWVLGGLSLGLLVAGLVSPWVGREIERLGGRPVLVASALLLATGLILLGLAHSLMTYEMGWLVLGLGMGSGLYDPAFAALGRTYGEEARGPITAVTLYAGFASTICWPLTALMAAQLGWRATCFVYAAVNLLLLLPLYVFALPREERRAAPPARVRSVSAANPTSVAERLAFVLTALTFTLAVVTMTVVAVHLLTILKASGLDAGAAVALGAMIGPSQVAARVIEILFGRRYHPIWTMLGATLLVALGIGVLLADLRIAWLGLILYGAGNGLRSVARGTLPLALFGPHGYAALMGRLAVPVLFAQAASPSVGQALLAVAGPRGTLLVLGGVTIANLAVAACLLPLVARRGAMAGAPPQG